MKVIPSLDLSETVVGIISEFVQSCEDETREFVLNSHGDEHA